MNKPKQDIPRWQDQAVDNIHSEISGRKLNQIIEEGDLADLSEFELMQISRHHAELAKKQEAELNARWQVGAKDREERIADAFAVAEYRMTPQAFLKKWG